jgi:hypothetical protein
VKRVPIAHAPEERSTFVPSWFSYRMLRIGTERAARISLAGPSSRPVLLDELDQGGGRDQLPFIKEILDVSTPGRRTGRYVPLPEPVRGRRSRIPTCHRGGGWDKTVGRRSRTSAGLDEARSIAAWNARGPTSSRRRGSHERAAVRRATYFEGPGNLT